MYKKNGYRFISLTEALSNHAQPVTIKAEAETTPKESASVENWW